MKIKGFTLMELVIVISLILILSVISVPIYKNYSTKAKFAEGYALLGRIASAQEAYFTKYGNFITSGRGMYANNVVTHNDDVLNINAQQNQYFTLFDVGTGGLGGWNKRYYAFTAIVKSNLGNLSMIYDFTDGVTII